MADFNRTLTYTDAGDLVDKLTTFLITSGPGPDWELEATYSSAGSSFLRTVNGSDVVYVHVFVDAADDNVAFLRYVEDDNTSNGWDAGTGPVAASEEDLRSAGTGIYGGENGGTATFIADEDRCIVTTITGKGTKLQFLAYLGIYTPHTDPSNDTYPNILASNGSALTLINNIIQGTHPNLVAGSFERRTLLSFPSSFIKSFEVAGTDAGVYQMWHEFHNGAGSETIPHRGQVIPMDDRASPQEIFAYEYWLAISENGRSESIFFTGLYRVSNKQTVGDTITIGVDDYLVVALSPDTTSSGPTGIAGPVGTNI